MIRAGVVQVAHHIYHDLAKYASSSNLRPADQDVICVSSIVFLEISKQDIFNASIARHDNSPSCLEKTAKCNLMFGAKISNSRMIKVV
jgi:hypothetical protein